MRTRLRLHEDKIVNEWFPLFTYITIGGAAFAVHANYAVQRLGSLKVGDVRD